MSKENAKHSLVESYLSFRIGDELFAAHVKNVLNILELTKITKVPKAPEYLKGVINLRGSVLPVIDSRLKFGMEEIEYTSNTCILVLELFINNERISVGAIVDSVQEVLEIDESQIQPPPSIGTTYRTDFITGMVKIEDSFVMLLDAEKVFSTDDILNLKDVTEDIKASTVENK
jgi:purine-binding chemotaxis protein CheW